MESFIDSVTDLLSTSTSSPEEDGPPESVSVSIVTVPVTVTATVSNTPTSTARSTTSTSTSHTPSGSTPTLVLSTSVSSTTDTKFVTTTHLTGHSTDIFTISTIISNPSGRVHDNQAVSDGSAFFDNRTAVIGVFTATGIIVFVMIAGLIAWAARRRKLKRMRQEEEEKNSRDFFADEVNDTGEQSEKSWWGNASGATISEGGVPLQVVTTPGYNNIPPMPSLPPEYSYSSAPKSPIESGIVMPHPYASTAPSVTPDPYTPIALERSSSFSTAASPIREVSRSPPPAMHTPILPYRNPSSGTQGGPLSQINENQVSSDPTPNHPFASLSSNRQSELFPEEVLWNLGRDGGIGRSLSGRRQPEPPLPAGPPGFLTKPSSPPPAQPLSQARELLYAAGLASDKSSPRETVHTASNYSATNISNIRPRPISGISDGGWYDDSHSEIGRVALAGATASGESFLNGNQDRNERFGYPYAAPETNQSHASLKHDKSATMSAADISEPPQRVPHDPRFSGLFGNVMNRQSEDSSFAGDHGYERSESRVLRVTNE